MSDARWDVPRVWTWVKASDVALIVGGGTPSTKEEGNFAEAGFGIPWIGPADLTGYKQSYIGSGRRDLTTKGLAASGARLLPKDAVLFSSRAPIGYCAIAKNPVATNQGFKSWICFDGVLPQYVRLYLLASVDYIDSLASGTTFREISAKRVETVAFPLPPAAEQRRIVAKLDVLTARIARGRIELDRVVKLAALLRTNALSRAFHSFAGDESVESLLIDDRTKPLHRLPKGWQWKALSELGVISSGLTKNRNRNVLGSKVKYLRVANVYANELRLENVDEIGCTSAELEKTRLEVGDVLIVEGNGSLKEVGRAAIWNAEIADCSHQNHLIRVRLTDQVHPKYLLFWLMSPAARQKIERLAASTSGLHTLSISKILGFPLPLSAKAEQLRIVAQIEATFARADGLEAKAVHARKLLDRLEAAILAKAFRGELVPQDPNDEPADKLLERIKAERAAAPRPKRGQRAAS